jgi:plasmid stability protein
MSKVHLEIPDDIRDALAVWAQARGISVPDAIRVILHDALDKESRQLTP